MINPPENYNQYLKPLACVAADMTTFPFIIHKNNKQLTPNHQLNLRTLIKQTYSKKVLSPLLAQSSLTYGVPLFLNQYYSTTYSSVISGTLSGLCEIKLTQHLAKNHKRPIPLIALAPLISRDIIYSHIFLQSEKGNDKKTILGPLVASTSTLPLDVAARNLAASRPIFHNFFNACKASLGPRVAAIYTSMGAVLCASKLF